MKVVVSYINSLYDTKKTIDLINETSADGIHVDLMDGIYVDTKNFDINTINAYFENNKKPLDIHLMVNNPSEFFSVLFKLNPDCIYVHLNTEEDIINTLIIIDSHYIKPAIVINPDEKLQLFEKIFPYVKRVLLMGVVPGKGGQKFINKTKEKLEQLKIYQEKYHFEIFVDGGINNETINYVSTADGVVSGSYVCLSQNYEERIVYLKNVNR